MKDKSNLTDEVNIENIPKTQSSKSSERPKAVFIIPDETLKIRKARTKDKNTNFSNLNSGKSFDKDFRTSL